MNLSFESKVALRHRRCRRQCNGRHDAHRNPGSAYNGKVVEWMEKVSDDQYAVLPS
jgi:hypothetical protein